MNTNDDVEAGRLLDHKQVVLSTRSDFLSETFLWPFRNLLGCAPSQLLPQRPDFKSHRRRRKGREPQKFSFPGDGSTCGAVLGQLIVLINFLASKRLRDTPVESAREP
jgi:hypothetical protein